MKNNNINDLSFRIHKIINKTTVLGPFERTAIWLQGCNKRCKGCISPTTHALDGGYEMSIDEVMDSIVNSGTLHVTISGGEPFLQSMALSALVGRLKDQGIGIIVYTGLLYQDLCKHPSLEVKGILESIDVLIDGEYIEELNDNRGLRGSSNQRVIFISNRYLEYAFEFIDRNIREIEVFFNIDGLFIAGLPTIELAKELIE